MGASPQTGQVIQNYRLLEKLGEGGMGVVYLAEDTRLGRKVAIKFLPAEAASDPVRRQRFEQEARAAAALSHPGIAAVYEMEETAGSAYIVFEYVRGATLRSLVSAGALARGDLLDVATDIAEALVSAHGAGIVHRDLKPENVMRTPEGNCKVLDFGLARLDPLPEPSGATPTETRLTAAGLVLGTVGYMSPEQLEAKPVDFRSDIFSFGALLYELATGVQPFQAGSTASTIAAILNFDPVPLSERNPVHPAELERIVRKCLRKRRDERYQSTQDLVVDLRNLKRETSGAAAVATAPVAPSKLDLGLGGDASDDEDNLFRAVAQRFHLTPRRWWDIHQLFGAFVFGPFTLWLALKAAVVISETVNTAIAQNWHGWDEATQALAGEPVTFWKNLGLPFFVLHVLLLGAAVMGRLYFIVLAAFVPKRLQEEIARTQRWMSIAYLLASVQFIVAGWLLLRVTDQKLIFGIEMVALGLFTLLAVMVVEPVMVRAAFAQVFAAGARRTAEGPRRGWFWAHYLATLFLTTPMVIHLTWQARAYMPEALRLPLFLFSSAALGLHWSARFAVVSTAFGDPHAMTDQMRRMRPWIRWTGWPVVGGLGATSISIAFANDVLAAIIGALAMGGVACLIFLDPAVERAAFPGSETAPSGTPAP